MLRNDRITSSYFSHCCCSSPHTAEIWALLVSTTLCADAADENCLQRGTRARTNDHIRAPKLTCSPIGQGDFHCSRSQEPARSQYELGSRVPVIFHVNVVQA